MAESESNIATGSTVEELVPERGATSVVWKWFGYKRSDVQQTTVICEKCKKTVPTKGGNTTNLFHHLKQKHLLEYEESQISRQEYFVKSSSISLSQQYAEIS